MSAIEPYDVILHLTLPATTANYELGNFMASLTLATSKNRTVSSVRRTVRILVKYYSALSEDKSGHCASSDNVLFQHTE